MFKKKYRAAKRDFTVEDLPSNRQEVFFDLLKHRWTDILFLGFLLLLFATPFLIARYQRLLVTTDFFQKYVSGELEENLAFQAILSFNNMINLIHIPLLVLFAIGLAGVIRIVKKLAWSEYISTRHDLLAGIKENSLHIGAVFLLMGLGNFLLSHLRALNVFSDTPANNLLSYLPEVVFVAIIFPVLAYFISLTAIYKEKFAKKLIIALKLYLLNLPKTLLVCLAGILPLLLLLVRNSLMQLIFPFVYVLVFLPVFLSLWFLFSCHVFDKHINKNNFPEIHDKGVWRKHEK